GLPQCGGTGYCKIRKIEGQVGNSVLIPVVVSYGCRAPEQSPKRPGRGVRASAPPADLTIAREHAWQPAPSPVVSPPPARRSPRQAVFAPTAARSPTATW